MLKPLFLLWLAVFCNYLSVAQVNEMGSNRLSHQHDPERIIADIDSATQLMWQGATHNPEALHQFESLLSESHQINFPDGVIRSLIGIAGCYYNDRQNLKSIQKLQEALAYANANGNSTHNGKLEGNIAIAYTHNSDYVDAIEHYTKALSFYEKDTKDNGLGKGNTLLNIAGLLSRMGRDSIALFYLDEAEKEAEKKNSDLLRCWIYYQRAGIYAQLSPDQWGGSETLLLQSLKIAIEQNFQPIRIAILTELGNLAAKSKEYDKALSYTQQVLALPLSELDKTENYLNLGVEYYHIKNYDAAINALLKSKEIAERNNFSFEIKVGIYQALSLAYRDTSFLKEAIHYSTLANDFKDSIIKNDLGKRIFVLEEKYEIAKRDKEIAQSQLKIAQQSEQLFRRKTWIISLLAFSLIASVGILLYLRNRQHIQRQVQKQALETATWQAALAGEEKERTRIARELHDNIGGSLSSLKMWFGSIRDRYSNLEKEKDYDEALSLLDGTLNEVRNTAHHLMPELLLQEGIINAVRIFCNNVQKASGLKIDYQYFGYIDNLDKRLELTLYRMIQELVQNVVKHAEATNLLVQLSCNETVLSITVEDNGKGFDATTGNKGLGISSIRRSVANFNGHFHLQTEPGNGTTIDIDIDLLVGASEWTADPLEFDRSA